MQTLVLQVKRWARILLLACDSGFLGDRGSTTAPHTPLTGKIAVVRASAPPDHNDVVETASTRQAKDVERNKHDELRSNARASNSLAEFEQ